MEISRRLSEELNMPAYLERDVCALALHQLEMGQSRNFMLLFVGIGIGAAIMSGGKLLGYSGYVTGELGHTTIRPERKHWYPRSGRCSLFQFFTV